MRRIDSKGFKEFHQKRLDEKKFFAEKKITGREKNIKGTKEKTRNKESF